MYSSLVSLSQPVCCRIGSLEIDLGEHLLKVIVCCRIGSLENPKISQAHRRGESNTLLDSYGHDSLPTSKTVREADLPVRH